MSIAKFEKVSYEEFKKDFINSSCMEFIKHTGGNKNPIYTQDICYSEAELEELIKGIYSKIKLPKRATKGSAGYDFFSPVNFKLNTGCSILIPTGIRCKMESSWVLNLYPRSGLGFKYRLQLNNTVGIIDSDYYNAKNEGHIMAKLTNDSNDLNYKELKLNQGDAFMQGLFTQYGLAEEEEVTEERIGGFGSTSK